MELKKSSAPEASGKKSISSALLEGIGTAIISAITHPAIVKESSDAKTELLENAEKD
jgi:hypothetical protein